MALIRNLSGLFAVTFVLTTTLDIWTTWVGVNQLGYTELNPFTDTSSIQAMAIPEVVALFIGIAMVAIGAHFSETLRPLPDERFASFYKRFWTVERFFHILVYFPIVFAAVRIVTVLSNTSVILSGWGLYEEDSFWFDTFIMFIFFLIFTRPTTYSIYLVCRASGP